MKILNENNINRCAVIIIMFHFLVAPENLLCQKKSTKIPRKPVSQEYWPTNGWRLSTLEEQGFDAASFALIYPHIDQHLPTVRSLLVVRHGYIVAEIYYHGITATDKQMVASVTKSITSALIGRTLGENLLKSVDQEVWPLLPEYFPSRDDSLKRRMTIKHLLTMTAGLRWDEFSSSSWSDMQRTPDWVEFVMKRPLVQKPGSAFTYNSGASHILSVIIKKISGKSAAEFGQQQLFDLMGITDIEWPTDSRGNNFGGWGMSLKPRDMAKFGYLYLEKGMWEEKQVIPKEYVRASTIRHVGGGVPMFTPYGYHWWVSNETGYNAFFAGGYGGQFIYVIPTLEMIVVITADPNVPSPPPNEQIRSIIRTFIIPSLKDGSH